MQTNTLYSSKANLWGVAMRVAGFDRGLRNYLKRLSLDCPRNSRILDVGCGTGIIGLTLARMFPDSKLLLTDIEEKFIAQARRNSVHGDFNERVSFGFSNIDTPDKIEDDNGVVSALNSGYFDIVSLGAVLGYSSDQHKTIETLAGLIKPGGYLISLEMSETAIGKIFSFNNHYHPIPLTEISETLKKQGFEVKFIPLSLIKDFPVSLTRVGLISRKIK